MSASVRLGICGNPALHHTAPLVERDLSPVTWREWDRTTRLACERLGVSHAQLGEMRAADVLLALRDSTPEGVDGRSTQTCRGCGGLALEVDARGRCRLCTEPVGGKRV